MSTYDLSTPEAVEKAAVEAEKKANEEFTQNGYNAAWLYGYARALQDVSHQQIKRGTVEITSIEVDRYETMPDGIYVKHVGMISGMEAFDALKEHLEQNGLLPDEYFLLSSDWQEGKELPDFSSAICHTDWGGNEGIYLDILLRVKGELIPFVTGKTLGESGDDFLKMSRIAAECSMMLNGRGCHVKFSEKNYDFGREINEKKRFSSLDEKIKTAQANVSSSDQRSEAERPLR